jgi:hypothetical protein
MFYIALLGPGWVKNQPVKSITGLDGLRVQSSEPNKPVLVVFYLRISVLPCRWPSKHGARKDGARSGTTLGCLGRQRTSKRRGQLDDKSRKGFLVRGGTTASNLILQRPGDIGRRRLAMGARRPHDPKIVVL